jgi:hypothetical protein
MSKLSAAWLLFEGLTLIGLVMAGAEAALLHGRVRFSHPAMWAPAAFLVLALGFGIPALLMPELLISRLSFYYSLWVALAVGVAGQLFHLRRAVRAVRSGRTSLYRALAVGPPPLTPLMFTVLGFFGLLAFELL